MAGKETAVKKYVVKLGDEERERLDSLIRSGKHPAQRLMKARILLKADAGESGEAWSDSQIARALDTSLATIARTRQQLVEEGFDAVLKRKHSPASARARIFDGACAEVLDLNDLPTSRRTDLNRYVAEQGRPEHSRPKREAGD